MTSRDKPSRDSRARAERPDYRSLPEPTPPTAWTQTQVSQPADVAPDPFWFAADLVHDSQTIA